MTENEAIKELETSIDLAKMCTQNSERKREVESYNMAIQALEEIQQYRAIGTPTQIYEKIGGLDVELGKYHSIGTVEELKSLKEKMEEIYKIVMCEQSATSCEYTRLKSFEMIENILEMR